MKINKNIIVLSTIGVIVIGAVYAGVSKYRAMSEELSQLKSSINTEAQESSSLPTVADKIYVKNLCNSKYEEVNKKLMDLAVSPGFETLKAHFEQSCRTGSTFDRLESPYYCENKELYVNGRDSFVSYCEDFYLN